MNQHSSVLIIGGGIIGSSIAMELAKEGILSTIIEKGDFFREASIAAGGMLCQQAEIFDFEDRAEILHESKVLYRPWVEELENFSRIPVQLATEGLIRVIFSKDEETEIKGRLSEAETTAIWLNPKELKEIEPNISDDISGGVLFPEDGHLHPTHLAESLYTAIRLMGCKVKQWTPALGFITDHNRVTGVRTAEGNLYADYTILAAGAWSSSLLSPFGVYLPVFPVKGQLFSVRSDTLSITKVIQGPNGAVIPRQDGTLTVGVTREEVGYDKTPTISGLSQIYQSASNMIPQLKEAKFLKTWAGLRPGTPDKLPYIGNIDGLDGLVVATGHFYEGIMLAPITAKIVSQIIRGDKPCINIKPFSPDRFKGKGQTNVASLTT